MDGAYTWALVIQQFGERIRLNKMPRIRYKHYIYLKHKTFLTDVCLANALEKNNIKLVSSLSLLEYFTGLGYLTL